MITKIELKNVASYKAHSKGLKTDKRINLIYGLNGAGKTVLSDYLRKPNNDEFKSCRMEGFNATKEKILVYNRKFLDDVFYESDTQEGVFSLSEENTEALGNIDKAIKAIEPLQENLDSEEGYLAENKKAIEKKESDIRDKVWTIFTEDTKAGDNSFEKQGFFDRLKKREKLFEKLLATELKDVNKTVEEIKKDLQQVGEGTTLREEIPKLLPSQFAEITEIEKNPIFAEEILGSSSGAVSELINRLGNSDWVKEGLSYVTDQSDSCPFCQQNTLTEDLKTEIKGYFDQSYQEKMNQLGNLEKSYKRLKDSISKEDYKKDFFDTLQIDEFTRLFENLDRILDSNLQEIKNKIQSPRQKVTFENTKGVIDNINAFISKRNEESNILNEKIKNRDATIENLKKEFWLIQRKEYESWIASYRSDIQKLGEQKDDLNKAIASSKDEIKKQEVIISTNRKNTVNIEQKIEDINCHLLDFGIKDFKIVKCGESHYRIQREHEKSDKPVFKSLSEGEKTVISFLYFVELCRGVETADKTKQKIIVIDDPISSLSQIYVFNIAQLIKQLFKNIGEDNLVQYFVLTHSLYFFHELAGKRSSEKENLMKFFRITKQDTSDFEEIQHSQIQNEYEVYWHVVKTATQDNMPLVANAMRNIIEYFFGFIEGAESINNIFQKPCLQGNKFQSFRRYIDRESHTDKMNINDYKEFDLTIFKEAFKQVFLASNHKAHHEKYMGIKHSANLPHK